MRPYKPKRMPMALLLIGWCAMLNLTEAAPTTPQKPSAFYDINADGILDFVSDAIYLSGNNGYTRLMLDGISEGNLLNIGGDNGILWYDGNVRHIDCTSWSAPIVDGDPSSNKYVYYPADVDNDGRLDLLKLGANEYVPDPQRYFTFNPSGRGMTGKLNVMSLDEYLNNPVYVGQGDGQSILSSMSGMDIWSPTPSEKSAGTTFELHDINNDGLPDIVDFVHCKIYYNLGSNGYATADFGGLMVVRDFNGDGIEDFILHDREAKTTISYIRQPDGSMKEKQILSGYFCGWKIFTADVNNDGFVDLVIPINDSHQWGYLNSGCKFILVLENKGDGTFKTHECPLPAECLAFDLRDIDNDGHHDLFLCCKGEGNSSSTNSIIRYSIDDCKLSATPETLTTGVQFSTSYKPSEGVGVPLILPDINNPGGYQINYGKSYSLQSVENQLPDAPSRPNIFYEPSTSTLKVNWQPSSDSETPTVDLTYSVRVGTAPGLDDIVTADALPDGRRRNITGGNAGYSLHRKFNTSSWPDSKIYISVQAIDGANGGSPFSEYAIFDKAEPASSFHLTYERPFSTGDKATVALSSSPKEGCSYQWDFADGHIVSSDANTQIYEIEFSTPGEKTISLTVSSPDKTAPTISQILDVQPATVKPGELDIEWYEINAAADLDEDGLDEIIGYGGKLYESHTPGAYTQIPRLYNNHASISNLIGAVAFDINGDGHVDFWGKDGTGAINQEDKGLDIVTDLFDGWIFEYKPEYYVWLDLNNNGYLDYVAQNYRLPYEYAVCSNDIEEYRNKIFTQANTMNADIGDIYRWEDYNGDGLIDFITIKNERVNNNWTRTCRIYENQGDFTFAPAEPFCVVTNDVIKDIRDFDNNGKLDVLISKLTDYGTYSLFMHWDDGEETPVLDGVGGNDSGQVIIGANYNTTYSRYDLDNNGYIDIYAPVAESVKKAHSLLGYIAYLKPGRVFEVKRLDWQSYDYNELILRGEPFVASDGKHYLATHQTYRYSLEAPNQRPAAPTNLRHSQNSKAVVIEWSPSMDDETPACRMRYNISIKRKGMDGEGAYIISPCNGAKDGIAVPTNKRLLNSTKFTIPVANIPAGEYEVKVQGIDLMRDASDFSETYPMTVMESCGIEMPATGEAGYPVDVNISSNLAATPDWNGGQAESAGGHHYKVIWSTPGNKTVTVGNESATIYIKEAPDASFSLPHAVGIGDNINISGTRLQDGKWEIRLANSPYDWEPLSEQKDSRFANLRIIDNLTANLTFRVTNNYEIRHTLSDGYATVEYSATITVGDTLAPEITLVDIDDESGKHRIRWNASTIDNALSINLYKETSLSGNYRLLANLPLQTATFIDMESVPEAKGARYMLTYALPYGESAAGTPHQPIHVMINRGTGNGWNLIWSKYEGIIIDTYRILRGDSPDNLAVIDEVSGNMTSYCDTNPPAGPLYYAVEIINPRASNTAIRRSPSSGSSSRSNVVAATGDASVNLVTGIEIYSVTGQSEINYQNEKYIDLFTRVTPHNATFVNPNWTIASGEDIATIDSQGRVTANGIGNGEVTVRAYAIDGSGINADFRLQINGVEQTGIDTPRSYSVEDIKVYPAVADTEIQISGLPADDNGQSMLYIFSVNGLIMHQQKVTGESAVINCSAFPAGVYIVNALSEKGNAVIRFIKC